MKTDKNDKSIILYDGECIICNKSIRFIHSRDNNNVFSYIPLNSAVGLKQLQNLGKEDYNKIMDLNTLILIHNKKIYIKFTATLKILGKLNGFWKLLSFLLLVPPILRDPIYSIIAHNRYKFDIDGRYCVTAPKK
jgi:predicted DCC family thiol-disulfide oxidoreductase YuxK